MLLTLINVALAIGTQQVFAQDDHQSCPADSPLSCSAGTQSTCCYEGSDGLFMLTQLWDYSPATGPDDLFTLHGLWPDRCDGGFNQFCNPSWEIQSATAALTDAHRTDLIPEMQRVWKNLGSNDESLWIHEFNKHGTCMATLNPNCYPDSAPKTTYVADFYATVLKVFDTLPTYKWLTDAGIKPSAADTFTYDQLAKVLNAQISDSDNAIFALQCDRKGALQGIYYYFHLKGSVPDGQWVPSQSPSRGNCPTSFKWLPKGGGGSNPPPGGKYHIVPSGQDGCIISNGHWYLASSGSCASFTVDEFSDNKVKLTSSKGPCSVDSGVLSCANGNTATEFDRDDSGNIGYNGNSDWSADHVPSGTEQVTVSNGKGSVSFQLTLKQ